MIYYRKRLLQAFQYAQAEVEAVPAPYLVHSAVWECRTPNRISYYRLVLFRSFYRTLKYSPLLSFEHAVKETANIAAINTANLLLFIYLTSCLYSDNTHYYA